MVAVTLGNPPETSTPARVGAHETPSPESLLTALRASQARLTAIDILEKLTLKTEDPILQRLAASALTRATTLRATDLCSDRSVPVRHRHSSDAPTPAADGQAPAPEPREANLAPAPQTRPAPGRTPADLHEVIHHALRAPDTPHKHSGLATLHAFADRGGGSSCTLNNHPLPSDYEGFATEALASSLATALNPSALNLNPPRPAPTGQVITGYASQPIGRGGGVHLAFHLAPVESPSGPLWLIRAIEARTDRPP